MMNTFEQIKDLCEKMNENNPFSDSQTVIIMGIDDEAHNIFQFAHGNAFNVVALIGTIIDSVAKNQMFFTRESILRILASDGGDEE